MGGDMVVALDRATVDESALFGHSCRRPGREEVALHRNAGRSHAPEERIQTHVATVSQARETYTALGIQSRGQWGYHHGVNVRGVAAGCTALQTRLMCDRPGLLGTDLVRLVLERCCTARQGVELIGDLVSRHGQGYGPGPDGRDTAFLLADGREAFALESAGSYWAYQEVHQARAMSDVCTIRQDWDGIARGLAGWSIERGWWPGDGSKLDFASVVAPESESAGPALRRWGRATLLLEEQNGHLDLAFFRRLLSDHYEGCEDEVDPLLGDSGASPICLHGDTADALATSASLVVQLPAVPAKVRVAWCCLGPPCTGVYLPVLLDGELPSVLIEPNGIQARMKALLRHIGDNPSLWDMARFSLGRLQARLDRDTEDFVIDAIAGERPPQAESARHATFYMQHVLERFQETVDGLLHQQPMRKIMVPALPQDTVESVAASVVR
jgi:hypothetical protein